jgi:Flavin-binding monooxygenase-like
LLQDGAVLEGIDSIIYCTGYKYHYPFLEGCGVVSTDNMRVARLYQHVFPPSVSPTLSFVGLPWRSLRYVQFELQARPLLMFGNPWHQTLWLPLQGRRAAKRAAQQSLETCRLCRIGRRSIPLHRLAVGVCGGSTKRVDEVDNLVCGSVCPLQSRWIARVLSGRAQLPSRADMEAHVDAFYTLLEESNVPVHYTHNHVCVHSCRHNVLFVFLLCSLE